MGSFLAVLPMAISSAGWTAIGAVGGALVGATAGGTIDWFFGARREKSLAKAGARLVAAEIAAVRVDPQKIVPMREEAAKAYNALAGLASHDLEGGLIKRPGDDD